jgi:hypothetical protein
MSERDLEAEHFAKLDREKLAKLKAKQQAEAAAMAAEELRQLHHHRCGKCGTAMDTHPFRGVEIEICPACGAVLLDNGELETLAGQDQTGIVAGLFGLFSKES